VPSARHSSQPSIRSGRALISIASVCVQAFMRWGGSGTESLDRSRQRSPDGYGAMTARELARLQTNLPFFLALTTAL
jgi:hypothetical protein